jgi:putative transposase
MKRSRFTEEQILAILKEGDHEPAYLVCRRHNISTATYYNWKARYAGLDGKELRAKRSLEEENATLKKLLAEKLLDIEVLRETLKRVERLGKS